MLAINDEVGARRRLVLELGHDHDRKLEPLGLMDREDADGVVVGFRGGRLRLWQVANTAL